MKGNVVLPKRLSESGFSLDTHIFRYRRDSDIRKDIGGVDTLVSSIVEEVEGNSIWHSAIGALNDPFEIYAKVNEHEFEQMTEEQKIKIWMKLSLRTGYDWLLTVSRDEMLSYYRREERRLNKTLCDIAEKNIIFKNLVVDIRDSIAIACFTSVCDSRLMWGYYCNGFSGVCLIYNKKKLLDSNIDLSEVKYHDGAFEVNIFEILYNSNETQQFEMFAQIMKTKHSEWAHEVETRSIIDLHQDQKGKGQLEKLGGRCIEGIIIGRSVRKDVRAKIVKLGKAFKIKIFSADVDYQIFGVKIS